MRYFARAALVAAFALTPVQRANAQGIANYDYENLSFRGVGLDIGRIWPNKVQSTEAYHVRFDLGFLGPDVRVVPSVGYWRSTFKAEELRRLATQLNRLPALQNRPDTITAADLGKIDWSDFSLSVDAQFVWTIPGGVYTYAGLGVGLHLLNGKGDLIANTLWENLLDSVTAGGAAMAGAEVPVTSSFRVFGEVRYTLLSDVRYPGLRVGGMYMLPTSQSGAVTGGK
jgi:opacity protein-like surface antigen